jgi:RNA polymerase sigma-B factor
VSEDARGLPDPQASVFTPLAPTRSAPSPRTASHAEQASTLELLARLAQCPRGGGHWAALRAEIVHRHLSLVRAMAWRFRGRGEDLDDLVQVGTLGLLHAIDRFDPTRGAEFTTYATPTIVGELKRHLRDRSGTVRVPRRLQERYAAVSRASVHLYQRMGRSPTVRELAGEIGATDEEVLEALESAQAYTMVPLESADPPAPAAQDTADALDGVEYRAALRPLLDRLPARDKRIILLRFFEHRTQSEIAAELGISQVQVSRLLTRTLTALRAALAE